MLAVEILNNETEVVDRVLIASVELAEQFWPGRWRLAPWQPEMIWQNVPETVSMGQARIALHRAGLLVKVDAAIASLSEPLKTEAELAWQYSNEVERHNGLVSMLAPALGLSEEQLDQLFITAASVRT